ncbi:MAG: DUF1801 domain-containing protein [Planctomycetes bacterium]|nr:DUF1801 domain-containing protein [Planctomycetota bacterium]MCC7172137.1 DUF1801 domain-containing protein [Planctomycetota bacterium]
MTTAEAQLESYFAKYEPAKAKLGKALRAKMRARLPGLHEIVYVYENQNALVIAYSPTENGYEGVSSIALYPSEAKLFFSQGAKLSAADPKKLLKGGSGVRHIVMNAVADFDRPEIEALFVAALELAKLRPDTRAKGSVIIRAESQKKRATRTSATKAKATKVKASTAKRKAAKRSS